MSEYDDKDSKNMKQELLNIDREINRVVKHVVFSLVASIFLGAFYYFFKLKVIGALLIFFIGYGLVGLLLISVALFIQRRVLKKEKEEKTNNLDF